jgi:outer membrane protein assembly factor BamC
MKYIIVLLAVLSLTSCLDDAKELIRENNEIGTTDIRYYADKTVASLEVPPDLTKPQTDDNVNLDNLVDTTNSLVSFDDSNKPVKKITNPNISIEVKKNNYQSYLVVSKDSGYVFDIVKNFLKDNGFSLEKQNKVIGTLETNFLENRTDIPDRNLGVIRSMLKSAVGMNYALPTLDKYRVRIESVDARQSEVYLTLNSMQEVVTSKGEKHENTIWQEKPRDEFLETEMLYRLMIYMGSDDTTAKQKIKQSVDNNTIKPEVKTDISGFAKMQFDTNKDNTWNMLSFAIDKLNINIEDRDKRDGSFYIKIANEEERGIMSSIFGDDAIVQNFRIKVKQLQQNFSEVYFIDLSGENKESTQKFSHTLFDKIKNAL